jgi:hypothetical protein
MKIQRYGDGSFWCGRYYNTDKLRIYDGDKDDYGVPRLYPRGFRLDLLLELFKDLEWSFDEKYRSRSHTIINGDSEIVIRWLIEKHGRSPFSKEEVKKVVKEGSINIINFLIPYVLADKLSG